MGYAQDFAERFGSLAGTARSVRASSSPTTTEIAFRGSGCAPRHRFTSESPVQIMAQRQATLDQAHAGRPERFARRPQPPTLREEA